MTYKTRQEVLRAAADWMDVCEKAGVEARCKVSRGRCAFVKDCAFIDAPSSYEFPLALVEGKEVWVGSELYHKSGSMYTVQEIETFSTGRQAFRTVRAPWVDGDYVENYSWNPPKPKTVMVEMLVEDAEAVAYGCKCHITDYQRKQSASIACKKALEKL